MSPALKGLSSCSCADVYLVLLWEERGRGRRGQVGGYMCVPMQSYMLYVRQKKKKKALSLLSNPGSYRVLHILTTVHSCACGWCLRVRLHAYACTGRASCGEKLDRIWVKGRSVVGVCVWGIWV